MLRTVRSIRDKVMYVVLATTFVALVVAAVALVVYETITYRDATIADLTTQADLLALTSAPALAFNDPGAASENLSMMRVRPGVLAGSQRARHEGDGKDGCQRRQGVDPDQRGEVPVQPVEDGGADPVPQAVGQVPDAHHDRVTDAAHFDRNRSFYRNAAQQCAVFPTSKFEAADGKCARLKWRCSHQAPIPEIQYPVAISWHTTIAAACALSFSSAR